MPVQNNSKYLKFLLSDAKDYPKRYKVYDVKKDRYLGYIDFSNYLNQLCYVPCSDHFHTVAELMELEHFMLELSKKKKEEVKP